MKNLKILYAKGGHAIEEAERLFKREGEIEKTGPDQFLLTVLANAKGNKFRLVSVGEKTERKKILMHEAIQYGARPSTSLRILKKAAYLFWSSIFMLEAIHWKPTHILCGIEGVFSVMALCAARLTGAKYSLLVHNALDLPSINLINRFANKIVANRADALVVHGPFLHDQVRELGAREERIFEFDTGFDPEKEILRGKINKSQKSTTKMPYIYFVYAGRIEESKGVGDLLNAFSVLRKKYLVTLIFIGEGSFSKKLLDNINLIECSSNVKILGQLSNQEVLELMSRATAVITPTQSRFPEGRCMSAMEALLMGTPVIAPNFGPFPYLIDDYYNGILYKPDDVPGLANAMDQLIEDRNLLEKLKRGAAMTGDKLKKTSRSFSDAIQIAVFEKSGEIYSQ